MLLLIGILMIFGIVSYFLGTWFVGLGQNDIDNEFYAALVGVSMFGTTTLIFVSFISINMIGLIYLVIRFYKTMYTQEGYLTFTLPVTVSQITNAKLISAVIWEIIMTCINILTVVVFVLGICSPLDVSLYEISAEDHDNGACDLVDKIECTISKDRTDDLMLLPQLSHCDAKIRSRYR